MIDWRVQQRLNELTDIIEKSKPSSPERLTAAIRAVELIGNNTDLPEHLLKEIVDSCDRYLVKAIDAGKCPPFSAVENAEDQED